MPEIKNNFTAGKMNKDLDERLVPVGQYRDALNIQVSTSESSDVGAVENVLGNIEVSIDLTNSVAPDSVCVGTISNEKDNSLYYFASSQKSGDLIYDASGNTVIGWRDVNYLYDAPESYTWTDRIYKIQNDTVTPVFVDNFRTKTYFDFTRNTIGGNGLNLGNYDYAVKSTVGVYEGMDCYFFAAAGHSGVTIGNIAINEMVAGQKIISRKVTYVDHANSTVRFDKNLTDLEDLSYPNSPGAEWVRSDLEDYNYLVFVKPRLLNFNCDNIITGINIIDNLLLFTDNNSEPKKINITRSIAGTDSGGNTATKLIVPDRDIDLSSDILVEEENITVIKKSPVEKIDIEQQSEELTSAVSDHNFTEDDGSGGYQLASPGTQIVVKFTQFSNGSSFLENEELRFLNINSLLSLPNNFDVRCKVLENLSGQQVGNTSANWPVNTYKIEILSISSTTPIDISSGPYNSTINEFNVVRLLDTDSLFEKKFVRFGYRWKYQDGEYSTFSPFTNVVFEPSYFEYDSLLAYNKAMQNNLTTINLRNIVSKNIPNDVVQVDILYSESNSPIVYIVDKLRYNDLKTVFISSSVEGFNNWHANQYMVKSDIIFNAVPENQTLRQWDNVPRKALAQEVTGNRIVYGNYVQNYNIINEETGAYEKPELVADYTDRWTRGIENNNYAKKVLFNSTYFDDIGLAFDGFNFPRIKENLIENLRPAKSLKSIRSYQLGFTYLDEYNRETPVFSSSKSTVVLGKNEADNSTQLTAKLVTSPPAWAKNYKIYVKETANEYYNLALDRVYKAEDGNLWLSFPSSERNKVDEETFLILKKGADSDILVKNNAKYKIIAIENEAPEFLKTKKRLLAQSDSAVFNGVSNALAPGVKTFEIDILSWSTQSSVDLSDIKENMQFDFKDTTGRYSKKYNVVNISNDTSIFSIVLETPILSTEDWMYSTGTTSFVTGLKIRFYKAITRVKPEFDGKFFVKINSDSIADTFLNTSASSVEEYEVVESISTFYLSDTGAPDIVQGTTHSVASTAPAEWEQYTSSNVNPHVLPNVGPGTIYSAGDSNSGFESADGPRDWSNLMDFAPGNSTNYVSNWFIDQTYYAGTHPSSSSNNISDPGHVTNSNSSFNYGRGIYEENGQNYIDLAFSIILPFVGGAGLGEPISNYGTLQREINYNDINENYIWAVGSSTNPDHVDQNNVVNSITPGAKFKFVGDVNEVIYTISSTVNITKQRKYNHTDWSIVEAAFDSWSATVPGSPGLEGDAGLRGKYNNLYFQFCYPTNRRVTYKIPIDKDINVESAIGSTISSVPVTAPHQNACAVGANENPITIQFLEQRTDDDNDAVRSSNPAIFETEPKESIDLDLFYSTGSIFPTKFNIKTAEQLVPLGSVVTCKTHPLLLDFNTRTIVTGFTQDQDGNVLIKFNTPLRAQPSGASELVFTRPNGTFTTLNGNWYTPLSTTPTLNFSNVPLFPNEVAYFVFGTTGVVGLSWFNCYSFGNGVESNRLRDDFNQVIIDKGVKVSTTTDEHYEQERRSSGLIYSGLYNSTSGINSLNQFIQAEKITKDLNPTYGSIQKLFSRNTDLVTFCEDRVIRIQANKDAVFNADGNPNLIATENVLGQTMPFAGDFGISQNPESFAVDNYRAYFTDKQRGAVLRLSKDGLTPISEYGMSNYFQEAMPVYELLIGSFDANKKDYNLTLRDTLCFKSSGETLSFNESVTGWTSFKSFILEQGGSVENKYYTFYNSIPWKHHDKTVPRNTFYGAHVNSTVEFLLNDAPDTVKSFKTINYEGSQARIVKEVADPDVQSNANVGFYNLEQVKGWNLTAISTDLEKGRVTDFVKKEGKWFNYIKGKEEYLTKQTLNASDFHIQGLGVAVGLPPIVAGCMDPNANNYGGLTINFDDGSCTYDGCTDANSYYGITYITHPNGTVYAATTDDGSCQYQGCMDEFSPSGIASSNYNVNATIPGTCLWVDSWDCNTVSGGTQVNTSGSGAYTTLAAAQAACPACVGTFGCKSDVYAMNYDPTVDCDDGSCLPYYYYGTRYDLNGNIISQTCLDDGTLTTTTMNASGYSVWPSYNGSNSQLDPLEILPCTVSSYTPFNSYTYTDVTGSNNPTDPLYNSNYGNTITVAADNATLNANWAGNAAQGCGCIYKGCMDSTNSNYMPWATDDDISMCCIDGCLDTTANNYLVPNVDCYDTAGGAYVPWDGTTGDCWIGTDPGVPGLLPCCPTCDDGNNCNTALVSFCGLTGNGAGTLTVASTPALANLPWNGNSIIETYVPDGVFEECLEENVSGMQAASFTAPGIVFSTQDGNLLTLGVTRWDDNTSCCSEAFSTLTNPYGLAIGLYIGSQANMTYSGGILGFGDDVHLCTQTRQDGDYISDLTGMQDFALQPLFERLVIHNQNISDFIHSETDNTSTYYNLDMLPLFWQNTMMYQISFKTLPLNNLTNNTLDLLNWNLGETIEVTDCGVGTVKVDRDNNPYMHSVIITNENIHSYSSFAGVGTTNIGGGGSNGYASAQTFIPTTTQGGYGDHGNGYSYLDWDLIAQVNGLFDDGSGNVTRPKSYSTGSTQHFPPHATSWSDGIYVPDNIQGMGGLSGTPTNPRYFDPNYGGGGGNSWSSSNYTMARLGENTIFYWDGSAPGSGNAYYNNPPGLTRYCNTRLILINLDDIEHVYIGPNWRLEFAQNFANPIAFGTTAPYTGRAALYVKGCGNGNGVKIHLGSQSRVNEFQQAYGTNDTNSPYWSSQGEAFFLGYFSSDVEFVI